MFNQLTPVINLAGEGFCKLPAPSFLIDHPARLDRIASSRVAAARIRRQRRQAMAHAARRKAPMKSFRWEPGKPIERELSGIAIAFLQDHDDLRSVPADSGRGNEG